MSQLVDSTLTAIAHKYNLHDHVRCASYLHIHAAVALHLTGLFSSKLFDEDASRTYVNVSSLTLVLPPELRRRSIGPALVDYNMV